MDEKVNIIGIRFGECGTAKTKPMYQWDKGQVFELQDEYIQDGMEVQFDDGSVKVILNKRITVPDKLLQKTGNFNAYIQVIGTDNETTTKTIRYSVVERPKKKDYVEPEDQQTFREDIQAIMNETKKISENAKDISEDAKTIADDAKKIANKLRSDADEGRFDGKDGAQGPAGPRGERGYTGERGPQGERGLTGERGPAGPSGPAGETGPRGETGPEGAAGHTPQKGIDYFTDEDKTELLSGVQREIDDLQQDLNHTKGDFSGLKERVDNIDDVIIETVEPLQKQADKTQRDVDMLYKISKGQLWDIESVECEGHAQLPSGGEVGNVDEVRGKTEQDSTNGYQLINPNNFGKTSSYNGVTWTNNMDGGFDVEGVPNSSVVNMTTTRLKMENGTYIARKTDITGLAVVLGLYKTDGSATTYPAATATKDAMFTIDDTISEMTINLQATTAYDGVKRTFYPMLEKGSTAHDYEKFSGGIPSPNPEYPQGIKSVEEIHVKKCGRNLYDGSLGGYLQNGNKIGIPSTGNGFFLTDFIPLTNEVVIQCNYNSEDANAWGVRYCIYNGDRNPTLDTCCSLNKSVVVVRPYSDGKYIRICAPITFEYLQVEYGSTATPYEPYHEESRTITPPRPLNAIGEYKDKCDVVNGVWEWNTNEVNTNRYNWSYAATSGGRWNTNFSDIKDNATRGVAIAEYFKRNSSSVESVSDFTIINASNGSKAVYIKDSNRLIDPNVIDGKIVYPIDTTTEPISPSDLDFLRNLTLLEGENLYITDNHGRDVSYLMSDFINLGKVGS